MKFVKLLCLTLALGAAPVYGAGSDYWLSGRLLYRFVGITNPDNSVFREINGESTVDHTAAGRFIGTWRRGEWSARADYQLLGLKGDVFNIAREVPEQLLFGANQIPTDRRRLFDLTSVITESDDYAVLHRLDRLWAGYTGDDATVRFGRQAITWGNGLIYTPMDFFNPFDPAAVDKEFKPGDDMIYSQYAFAEGDDLQGVLVFRRDLVTGDVEADKSTLALKYHGFRGSREFDVLAAEHYGDAIIAAGGNREFGGTVWRGDGVVTRTGNDTVLQLVTSLSRSWIARGRNMSGAIEYFYNGFGQSDGDYSQEALADNPELVERVARGELFTLARHYIAASTTIEMTPLILVTPNLFLNLTDGSALFQAVAQYDVRQDMVLLGSLNIPIGPDGTEFGGIPSAEPGRFLSTGPGLFLQFNAYF